MIPTFDLEYESDNMKFKYFLGCISEFLYADLQTVQKLLG